MIFKVLGILYILQIIAIYVIVIYFDRKDIIKAFKTERKRLIKWILRITLCLPIMPLIVLYDFMKKEYNL